MNGEQKWFQNYADDLFKNFHAGKGTALRMVHSHYAEGTKIDMVEIKHVVALIFDYKSWDELMSAKSGLRPKVEGGPE